MAASEESKNILEDIRKRIDSIDYTSGVRESQDENRKKRLKTVGVGNYGSFMKNAINKRGGGQNTPSYEEFVADQPKRIADSIAATYAGIKEGEKKERPSKKEIDAIKLFETQYQGIKDPGAKTESVKNAAGSFENLMKFTELDDDKRISEKNYNTLVERLRTLGYKGPDISNMDKTEELLGINRIDSQNDLRKLYDKYIKKNLDLEGRYETADSLASRAGYLADQDALAADQEKFKDLFGKKGVIGRQEVRGMLNVEGQSPAQVRAFLDNYMNTYGGTVKSNAYDIVRDVSDDVDKYTDPKGTAGEKVGIGKFMQDQINNVKDVYGRGPLSPGVLDGAIAMPKPAPEFDLQGTIYNSKPAPEFKGSAKISKSGWMELYPKGGDIGTGNRISPAEWMTLYPKGGDLYR